MPIAATPSQPQEQLCRDGKGGMHQLELKP
jgi:hypothetical protein